MPNHVMDPRDGKNVPSGLLDKRRARMVENYRSFQIKNGGEEYSLEIRLGQVVGTEVVQALRNRGVAQDLGRCRRCRGWGPRFGGRADVLGRRGRRSEGF